MIDPLPVLSSPVTIGPTASAPQAGVSAGAATFGQTFAALLDPRDTASDPTALGGRGPSDTATTGVAAPPWTAPPVPAAALPPQIAAAAPVIPASGVSAVTAAAAATPATPSATVAAEQPARGLPDRNDAATVLAPPGGPPASPAKPATRANLPASAQTPAAFVASRDAGSPITVAPQRDGRHDPAAAGTSLPNDTAAADAATAIPTVPVPPVPLPIATAKPAPGAHGERADDATAAPPTPISDTPATPAGPLPPRLAADTPAPDLAYGNDAAVAPGLAGAPTASPAKAAVSASLPIAEQTRPTVVDPRGVASDPGTGVTNDDRPHDTAAHATAAPNDADATDSAAPVLTAQAIPAPLLPASISTAAPATPAAGGPADNATPALPKTSTVTAEPLPLRPAAGSPAPGLADRKSTPVAPVGAPAARPAAARASLPATGQTRATLSTARDAADDQSAAAPPGDDRHAIAAPGNTLPSDATDTAAPIQAAPPASTLIPQAPSALAEPATPAVRQPASKPAAASPAPLSDARVATTEPLYPLPAAASPDPDLAALNGAEIAPVPTGGPTQNAQNTAPRANPPALEQTLSAFLTSRDAARAPHEEAPRAPAADDDHAPRASDSDPADSAALVSTVPPMPAPALPVPTATTEPASPTGGDPTNTAAAVSPALPSATPSVTARSLPPRLAAASQAPQPAAPDAAALAPQDAPLRASTDRASPRAEPRPPAAPRGARSDDSALPATDPTPIPEAQPVPPLDRSITAALDAALTRATAVRQDATPAPRAAADATQPLARAAPDRADATIIASTVPQPAGRVFAAAIATAWRDRTQRSGGPDGSAETIALGGATPIQASERTIVSAAGDASQSGLDLTQDSGLQRMIAHIETLRDDADSRDTRIRLVPDALGGVDVAVRQVGDRVHVHFTAEQEATRALLADAQPRLTELATARGLRIGDTSVSADAGRGDGAAPQPRPTPFTAQPPRAATAETEIPTDARVA